MAEKRKKKDPEKIFSILERVLSGLNLGIKAKQFEIWEVWDSVVGQHISRHAQPQQIRNMVLWTVVTSSTWMQQLGFMKKTIVDRLNERIGEEVVKDIKFRMGEFPPPDSKNDKKNNTSSPSPHQ